MGALLVDHARKGSSKAGSVGTPGEGLTLFLQEGAHEGAGCVGTSQWQVAYLHHTSRMRAARSRLAPCCTADAWLVADARPCCTIPLCRCLFTSRPSSSRRYLMNSARCRMCIPRIMRGACCVARLYTPTPPDGALAQVESLQVIMDRHTQQSKGKRRVRPPRAQPPGGLSECIYTHVVAPPARPLPPPQDAPWSRTVRRRTHRQPSRRSATSGNSPR